MKKGQKVKVTARLHGHKFQIGEIVECIWFKGGKCGGDYKSDTGARWAMNESEFEIIGE